MVRRSAMSAPHWEKPDGSIPSAAIVDLFAKLKFIEGVEEGWVRFNYHGRHQELVRQDDQTGRRALGVDDSLRYQLETVAGRSFGRRATARRSRLVFIDRILEKDQRRVNGCRARSSTQQALSASSGSSAARTPH